MTTQTEPVVHHVIRVAGSDTIENPIWVHNGVAAEDLTDYVEGHKRIRPSAALFVDGNCVFTGTLQEDHVRRVAEEVKRLAWKVDIITRPYR